MQNQPRASWFRRRLSRQIILPTVVGTVLCLLLLGLGAAYFGREMVRNNVTRTNERLAAVVGRDINKSFQQLLSVVDLQRRWLLAVNDPEAQEEALLALRQEFPQTYGDLVVVDPAGQRLIALPGSLGPSAPVVRYDPPIPFEDQALLQPALTSQAISISSVGARDITGSPVITVAIPLLTLGTPSGALVAQIDLESFWTSVDSLLIEGGSVSIVDADGRVLVHSDRSRVGEVLPEKLEPLLTGDLEGTMIVGTGPGARIISYSPLVGPLNWGVAVEQSQNAALASVRLLALVALLATLASGVVMSLALAWLLRRALRPVTALSTVAETIAATGDAEVDLADSARADELGVLSSAFAKMLSSLRASQTETQALNQHLEAEVARRTAELQAALDDVAAQTARQQELFELLRRITVPIIPILRGVIVMPLIGELTAERADEVVASLLAAIAGQNIRVALIDITGVPLVDETAAEALLRAARGAQLLGAKTILAGIRPEIAQTLVALGNDFATLQTTATLEQAVALAQRTR